MDTKKYIIEIPDNTAWLQWVKVSDKDGHVCFDFKYPEDLTPYTESDLEQVRKEAYEEGYKFGYYSDGYQRGLKDAWEAARKINVMDSSTRDELFGLVITSNITNTFSASEVIEKIREHEKEQEEIKVWDEVQHKSCNSIKIIVLNKDSDVITGIAIEDVPYACKVGEMYINRDVKDWEKTGKHYEIAEVLKKMREKKL